MNRYEELMKRHRERKRRDFGLHSLQNRQTDPALDFKPYDMPVRKKSPRRYPVQLALQCLGAALLFGLAYWAEVGEGPFVHPIRESVETAMTHEFQFTAVSGWYEKYLGDPLAFLPGTEKTKTHVTQAGSGRFEVPVSGEVMNPYTSKTKGVTVETSSFSAVKAVKDGLVVYVGKKPKTGTTVIIQHSDHDESWYGKLGKTNVKVYDEVKKGQKIGTTSGGDKGTFYFALKKGEKFIDPIQVMSFD
ncbi:MAG: M23 family metallopeptidase [Sporolactobacillus sp.]|jgi:stage IV sporulation protein FA|nr:M23 family metallopeptidase [Sporolactobacillus sp.]